jgi:hypothetical protein
MSRRKTLLLKRQEMKQRNPQKATGSPHDQRENCPMFQLMTGSRDAGGQRRASATPLTGRGRPVRRRGQATDPGPPSHQMERAGGLAERDMAAENRRFCYHRVQDRRDLALGSAGHAGTAGAHGTARAARDGCQRQQDGTDIYGWAEMVPGDRHRPALRRAGKAGARYAFVESFTGSFRDEPGRELQSWFECPLPVACPLRYAIRIGPRSDRRNRSPVSGQARDRRRPFPTRQTSSSRACRDRC